MTAHMPGGAFPVGLVIGALALVAACSDGSDTTSASAPPTGGDTVPGDLGADTVPATDTAAAGDTATDAGADAVTGTDGEVGSTPATEPAGDSTAPPAQPVRDFSALDETIDDFVEDRGLEGAGFVVVDAEGGVVHEHYNGPFGPDRVSFVASSSKMVSAGVLMRLHDAGDLDIDAPVADAVVWGSANPEITPAQLVSSSSGLVGLGPDLTYAPYECQWDTDATLQDCGEQIFTTEEDDDDVIPPDTRFRYGGGQWQVAGAVAEAVSARSWAELVEETYVEPCGLRSTGYANPFADLGAAGFRYPSWAADELDVLATTANPNIEAGLFTTPADYAQLLLMHLRDGRCGDEQVLAPESVERLHEDRIGPVYGGSAGDGMGYGMGWWVDRRTGRIVDSGAYGAVPWLDLADGYGAYLVIEADSATGLQLADELEPVLDDLMSSDG